jgi:hypothetical protein
MQPPESHKEKKNVLAGNFVRLNLAYSDLTVIKRQVWKKFRLVVLLSEGTVS